MPSPPKPSPSLPTPDNPQRATRSTTRRVVALGVLAVGALTALAAVVAMSGDGRVNTLQPVLLTTTLEQPDSPQAPDGSSALPPRPPAARSEVEPIESVEPVEILAKTPPAAKPNPSPHRTSAPTPPPRGSDRAAWLVYVHALAERRTTRLAYAQTVAERRTERAAAQHSSAAPISDGFGRAAGQASYPNEEATDLKLRLNAIVDPRGREPFAIIEDQGTGLVASYREGTVLPPGVLPGVWVVDVEPGVVHLLDLGSNSFEYLTFAKPPKQSLAARRAKRRRDRARERAKKRKKRRSKKRR